MSKTLSFVDGEFVSSLGFKVPKEVTLLCDLNKVDNKYKSAYINSYINHATNNMKSEDIMELLHRNKPFYLDGSCLTAIGKPHYEELVEKYWPNMTKGINKFIRKNVKDSFDVYKFMTIGILYGDEQPNNQLALLEIVKSSQVNYLELEKLVSYKSSIFKLFSPNKFKKKIKKDKQQWVEHIISIVEIIPEINEVLPDYKIPLSYDLGILISVLNNAKTRAGKIPTPFKFFWHQYGFFNNLNYKEYTLIIPKDNFELSDWGSKLKNCVGGSDYAEKLINNEKFIGIILKNGKPFACAEYPKNAKYDDYLLNDGNVQLRGHGNNEDQHLDEEDAKVLDKFICDIVSGIPIVIQKYITTSFAEDNMVELFDTLPFDKFKNIASAFGVKTKDVVEKIQKLKEIKTKESKRVSDLVEEGVKVYH